MNSIDATRLLDRDVDDATVFLNHKSQMRAADRADLAVPVALNQRGHRHEVLRATEVGHFKMSARAAATLGQAKAHALALQVGDARSLRDFSSLGWASRFRIFGIDFI